MCSVTIKQQRCGCEDFLELKVAFGDMTNCQLKCIFCFTHEQRSSQDQLSDLRHVSLEEVRIIRFTGGEPLMSQNQIEGILRELFARQDEIMENIDLVVVQTNAIGITTRNLQEFSDLHLPILFEVSLKGTNATEYRYLTFPNPISHHEAESIFSQQVQGYTHLTRIFADEENIAILARLGIFHSSLNNPQFKFIYPSNMHSLMFVPSGWDDRFHNIWLDQRTIWNETFDGKMVVEKLKTPGDGSPVMGRRYRAIIEHLKSRNLLVEDLEKPRIPEEFRAKYFFKRGNQIYEAVRDCLGR